MYKQHSDKKYSANIAENYERFFVPSIGKPLAIDLVNKAKLKTGETILDVACGTGIVTRLAFEKVNPSDSVAGLDINPGMLAVARSANGEKSAIEWYEASVESMPFADNTYDAVLCQMGLQFVDDKIVALKEMKRVLSKGGRLVLNLPGPSAEIFISMAEAMKKNINEKAAGFVKHVFSLYDKDEIQQLFEKAGFAEINIYVYEKDLQLPEADEFLWQYIYSTPLVNIISGASESACDAMEKDIVEMWKNYAEKGNITYKQPMVTVIAKK